MARHKVRRCSAKSDETKGEPRLLVWWQAAGVLGKMLSDSDHCTTVKLELQHYLPPFLLKLVSLTAEVKSPCAKPNSLDRAVPNQNCWTWQLQA